MHCIKSFILLGLCLLVFACEPNTFDYEGIPIQQTLRSEKIQETYQLDIILPKDYNPDSAPYPVIYQLDGNYQAELMASVLEDLQKEWKSPAAIVVGIGYESLTAKKRFRDMTYPPDPDEEDSGRGDEFYDFLVNTVIPLIDSQYSTDPNKRVLSGHSLGGYFSLWTMFYESGRKAYFSDFIAASPSCQYKNGVLLEIESDFNPLESRRNQSLYLGIGGRDFPHLNIYYDEMLERLLQKVGDQFSVDHKRYLDLIHAKTKEPVYKDGIEYLFNP